VLLQQQGGGGRTCSRQVAAGAADAEAAVQAGSESVVVLSVGSGTVMAGRYGADVPAVRLPCIVGYPKGAEDVARSGQEFWVGHDAEAHRGILRLVHPIEQGVVKDWDALRKVLAHTFRLLGTKQPNVILLRPSLATDSQANMVNTILFSACGVKRLRTAQEPVEVLAATGRATGLVVDCGAGVVRVTPVLQGGLVREGVALVPFGGYHLDLYLIRLLRERGLNLTTSSEHEIARDIKETQCFVAQSYEEELRSPSRAASTYQMPDLQEHQLGTERFRAMEPLFAPNMLGLAANGLPHQVLAAVKACPAQARRELLLNIVLCGGLSQLPGLEERLRRELAALVPPGTQLAVCTPANADLLAFRQVSSSFRLGSWTEWTAAPNS